MGKNICDRCPFRKDRAPYLPVNVIKGVAFCVKERNEIFPCHKIKSFHSEECHDHDWCEGAKQLLRDGKVTDPVLFDNVEDLVDHHKRLDDIVDNNKKSRDKK